MYFLTKHYEFWLPKSESSNYIVEELMDYTDSSKTLPGNNTTSVYELVICFVPQLGGISSLPSASITTNFDFAYPYVNNKTQVHLYISSLPVYWYYSNSFYLLVLLILLLRAKTVKRSCCKE